MSLKLYQSKRSFKKTPEPETSKKTKGEALNFCIQKHAARRLHYDFRLEYRGVLLSWAVPKGPSLNPHDKRLAIKVEDHPLDYQYFEGVIPKGNYGAGLVEIWDHGFFTMPHTGDRMEIEKNLTEGLKKGHFAIILHGEKLNGEFILQKLKNDPDDSAWLLIKKGDAFQETETVSKEIKPKKKSKMPDFVPPMLATLIDQAFDSDDWLFEIKWDGFRALAFAKEGKIELKSRNNLLFNEKFPSIAKELSHSKEEVILDGEIVAVDTEGKSSFQLIQNSTKEQATLCYYVFDLLYQNGEDLRNLPLIERKERLENYLKELNRPLILYSDHILKDGTRFFNAAAKKHLEGVIGKKSQALINLAAAQIG